MRHCTLLLSMVFIATSTLTAQQATVPGATVSGTVFCDDTGKPAHFARVFLTSSTPGHTGEDFMQSMAKAAKKSATRNGGLYTPPTGAQLKQQMDAARRLDAVAGMLSATQAGMDGTYRATGLKPGTYYVHAQLAGYVDPYAQLSPDDFTSTDPAIRARIAALPTVLIGGENESQTLNLRLQRGAALSGRVLLDDGTPAAEWNVWAVRAGSHVDDDSAIAPALQRQAARDMGQPATETDDRGNFRIAGLPQGDYTLRVNIGALSRGTLASNAGQAGSTVRIAVYSGNTLHRASASTLTVRGGEEQTVPDMTVPLKSLRTLSGRVTSAVDGHPLNKGTVLLVGKDDPAITSKAFVTCDGSFAFEDLPGGATYTLTLDDAADATYTDAGQPSFMGITVPRVAVQQAYMHASQDVMLGAGDNTAVTFALTIPTPETKAP